MSDEELQGDELVDAELQDSEVQSAEELRVVVNDVGLELSDEALEEISGGRTFFQQDRVDESDAIKLEEDSSKPSRLFRWLRG